MQDSFPFLLKYTKKRKTGGNALAAAGRHFPENGNRGQHEEQKQLPQTAGAAVRAFGADSSDGPGRMIARVPVMGRMEVNCYIWTDDETGHGFLIDPGAQGRALAALCREKGWTIESILLTHGHFDHIGGIADFCAELPVPVRIHEEGIAYLRDPRMNLSRRIPPEITVEDAETFRDGAFLALQARPERGLRVIHTPGHTRDSVLLYDEEQGIAFSGDTIFRGSRGNDSFPGGDGRQLLRSIRERVLSLPEDTVLYSGHTEETTVKEERSLYL